MSSRHHNEHHKAQSAAHPPNISFCSQNSRSAGTCTKMIFKKNSLDVWGISSLSLFSFVLIQFVQHTVYSSLVCYRDLTLSKCCMMPVAWDTSTPVTISVKGRLGTMLVFLSPCFYRLYKKCHHVIITNTTKHKAQPTRQTSAFALRIVAPQVRALK